ncbi:hypothetical protein [Methanobrevibacter arboriphilus]|uniref:hypothetical protein n=1 Tax=Methanobrevibacter arboriphilus TaxID=39441 RepID=UPI001E2B20C3|nr:hypothetical protein [Methanobrevibacter arboriphilus]
MSSDNNLSYDENNYKINMDDFSPEYSELESFNFSSGKKLKSLPVEYFTIGTPITDDQGHINNAIIFLHGWGGGDCGSIRRIDEIIGPKNHWILKNFYYIYNYFRLSKFSKSFSNEPWKRISRLFY